MYAANYTSERNRQLKNGEPDTIQTSHLTCQCANNEPGVSFCESGRKVHIKSSYWGGNLEDLNIPEAHEVPAAFNWTEEDFLDHNGDFEPRKNFFATALCSSGMCSKHGGKGEWILNSESPCKEGLHRTGVLCGGCKKGYRWSFGSTVSE